MPSQDYQPISNHDKRCTMIPVQTTEVLEYELKLFNSSTTPPLGFIIQPTLNSPQTYSAKCLSPKKPGFVPIQFLYRQYEPNNSPDPARTPQGRRRRN